MTTDRPRKPMGIVQPPALRAGAEPFRHRFDRFAHFPAGGARWGGIADRSLALRSISRWLRPSGPTPAHSVFAPLLLDLRRLRRDQQQERPTRTVWFNWPQSSETPLLQRARFAGEPERADALPFDDGPLAAPNLAYELDDGFEPAPWELSDLFEGRDDAPGAVPEPGATRPGEAPRRAPVPLAGLTQPGVLRRLPGIQAAGPGTTPVALVDGLPGFVSLDLTHPMSIGAALTAQEFDAPAAAPAGPWLPADRWASTDRLPLYRPPVAASRAAAQASWPAMPAGNATRS